MLLAYPKSDFHITGKSNSICHAVNCSVAVQLTESSEELLRTLTRCDNQNRHRVLRSTSSEKYKLEIKMALCDIFCLVVLFLWILTNSSVTF